ncbi:6620_t:CDS:2 [Funneliformis geosporum]|uniref:17102_t:CDS:1 n=1 Tax=Funneliformis geosporum TaxID=1117311 RepID=A0A9W4WWP5_9GLOM|nr:6620_t:CDS:2 [Funneliformis geosporum]CAI2192279.1 17102_t:CDS:2 [Funneliformis geosporum]
MPLRSRSFSVTTPAPLVQRSQNRCTIHIHNDSLPPRITAKSEPVSPATKHALSSVTIKGSTIPHLPSCKCSSCKEQLEIRLAHDAIVDEVARKLKSPAFEAFLNQRVSLTNDQLDKMELAKLNANVDKLPPRYPAQDGYLRKDIHKMYFNTLAENLSRLEDPTLYERQRFVLSNEKEEAMYTQRMFKRVSRALKHRFITQDAEFVAPEERKQIKFQEIEGNLSKLVDAFPQFDNQRFEMNAITFS